MARSIARGKALVAKLRKDPKVRDAEALAAWIGRVKKYKKAGLSTSAAMKAANERGRSEKTSALKELADEGGKEQETKEERQARKYEEKQIRAMEKAQTSALYNAIMENGGIKTSDTLREEYRNIPNTFIRTDGLPGDEMADMLATYYPELGIESENDLIDFFWERRARAA